MKRVIETIGTGVLKCGKFGRPVTRAAAQNERGVIIQVLVVQHAAPCWFYDSRFKLYKPGSFLTFTSYIPPV
jgi:hypothetical protein